jgi:hypothetical protein
VLGIGYSRDLAVLLRCRRVCGTGSLLLSGSVKRVLQKGKFNRDELLREVRDLVALACENDTGRTDDGGLD